LTLDQVIWHTVVHNSSTSTTCQISFESENFLRTNGFPYIRMDMKTSFIKLTLNPGGSVFYFKHEPATNTMLKLHSAQPFNLHNLIYPITNVNIKRLWWVDDVSNDCYAKPNSLGCREILWPNCTLSLSVISYQANSFSKAMQTEQNIKER